MASAKPQTPRARTSGSNANPLPKRRSNGDARASSGEQHDISAADYIRQHPVMSAVVAVGIGALLQAALTAVATGPAKGAKKRKPKAAKRDSGSVSRPANPRTHHFGAADMKFTTQHPDGKNVEFKFAWKKRPVDAPETDWPQDQTGFTAVRPDGRRTAFAFTGKTRPIPDEESAVGDNRPGLGWAEMEFTSSAPGRKDFTFNWSRKPPAAAANTAGKKAGRTAKKSSRKKKSG